MIRTISEGDVLFQPIQCSSEYINSLTKDTIQEGALYFVLDSQQIFLGTHDENLEKILKPMGKGTGILYGKKEFDPLDLSPEVSFTKDDFKNKGDVQPGEDDLILNEDGCFYRINQILGNVILATRLTVAGGGGGGNGVVSGGTGSSSFTFGTEDGTPLSYVITTEEEVEIRYYFTDTYGNVSTGNGEIEFEINGLAMTPIETEQSEEGKQLSVKIPTNKLIPNFTNKVYISCYNSAGQKLRLPSPFTITVIDLSVKAYRNEEYIFHVPNSTYEFNYEASGVDCKKQVFLDLYDANDNLVKSYTTQKLNEIGEGAITDATKKSSFVLQNLTYGVYTLKLRMSGTLSSGKTLWAKELTYKILCTNESEFQEKDYINHGTHIVLFASYLPPNSETNDYVFDMGQNLKYYYMYYDPRESEKMQGDSMPIHGGRLKLEISDYNNPTSILNRETRTTNLKSLKYDFYEFSKYPNGKIYALLNYEFQSFQNANEQAINFSSALGATYNNKTYTASVVKSKQMLTVNEVELNYTMADSELVFNLTAQGRRNNDDFGATWTYAEPDKTEITTTFTDVDWIDGGNGWIIDSDGDTALRLSGDARATINFSPFGFKSGEKGIGDTGFTCEVDFVIRDVHDYNTSVITCFGEEEKSPGFSIGPDTAILSSDNGDTLDCKYSTNTRTKLSFVIDNSGGDVHLLKIYLNGVLSRVIQYADNCKFQQTKNPSAIKMGSSNCCIDIYKIRCYTTNLNSNQILGNYISDITNKSERAQVEYNNNIWAGDSVLFNELKKRIPVMVINGALPTSKTPSNITIKASLYHNTNALIGFENQEAYISVQGTSSLEYAVKNYNLMFKEKQSIDNKQLPTRLYCLKADYADSTGTHNTQHANFIHQIFNYNLPISQENGERFRTTIFGYPIVLFHNDGKDNYTFLGKYNINHDRYSYEPLGFGEVLLDEESSKKYKLKVRTDIDIESWEGDNNIDECKFTIPLVLDSENSHEAWAKKCSSSGDLREFKKLYDWIYSTYKNKATNATLESLDIPEDKRYGYSNDTPEYRITKFKKEFEDYLDLTSCLFYYVYTFTCLMIDQRAKNMVLTKWGDGKWMPYFYDNDSCLGIDNQGQLKYTYSQEIEGGAFTGQDSVLWSNLEEAFGEEIREAYHSMRSSFSEELFLDYFIRQGSNAWCESLCNLDAQKKYIDTFNPHDTTKEDGTSKVYLDKALGTGEEHLKYFIKNRLEYCDTKWGKSSSDCEISFRSYSAIHDETEIRNAFTSIGLNYNTGLIKYIYNYLLTEDFANLQQQGTKLENVNIIKDGIQTTLLSVIEDGIESGEFNNENIIYTIFDYLGFSLKFNTINLLEMTKSNDKYIYNKNGVYKELSENQYNTLKNDKNYTTLIVINTDESVLSKDTQVTKRKLSQIVQPASHNITLTAAADTYLNVHYGEGKGNPVRIKYDKNALEKNRASFVSGYTPNLNFDIKIPGSNRIAAVGDFSNLYVGNLYLSGAKSLKKLQIGTELENYYNNRLNHLDIMNLRLLEELDLSNCAAFEASLDVSTCPNLKTLKLFGTQIPAVNLSPVGVMETLKLPKSISKLELFNQKKLCYPEIKKVLNDNETIILGLTGEKNNDGMLLPNLSYLNIQNCNSDLFDSKQLLLDLLLNYFDREIAIRITGINWTLNDADELLALIDYCPNLQGIGADGYSMGKGSKPQLYGTCHIPSLSGEEMQKISEAFPNLKITFDALEAEVSFWIGGDNVENSRYEEGENAIYEIVIKKNQIIYSELYTAISKTIIPLGVSMNTLFTNLNNQTYQYKLNDDLVVEIDVKDEAVRIAPNQIVQCINSRPAQATNPIPGIVSTPKRLSSDKYHYKEFLGWSVYPNSAVDSGTLNNISKDIKLYAVYSKEIRKYKANFYGDPINPTGTYLGSIEVNYGDYATYNYDIPVYPGAKDDYEFNGWNPSLNTTKIIKDTNFQAKYLFIGAPDTRLLERAVRTYPENNEIKNIGDYAFYNCSLLYDARFPYAESIGEKAFCNCSNLTTLVLGNANKACTLENSNAFENTPIANGTGYIYVPDKTQYNNISSWENYIGQIKNISELTGVMEVNSNG